MTAKEKVKDILDWTQSWANIDWGYMALLRQDLEELVEITKMEQAEEDAHMCYGCRFRL